jgi:argininosuccinate synthase
MTSPSRPRIILAFSGGLDTSFCVLYLKEELKAEVETVTVDTGGFDRAALDQIAERSRALGAARHHTVEARQAVYDQVVSYLIKGNVLKGEVYPLCVAAERVIQAQEIVRVARERGAAAVAHGSTGAGNDQIRFDIAFSVLAPDLPIHTPIRKEGLSREETTQRLKRHGFETPPRTTRYSINSGLWGTTIGGGEIHDPWSIPDPEAYPSIPTPESASAPSCTLTLAFREGLPVALDGKPLGGVPLVEQLNHMGAERGYGRGIHLGETALGIKGRIAFEAPAPLILVQAHRELEKLVLTKWQIFWKKVLADFYGQQLHEGLYFDPVLRDIEAFIDRSQHTVSGEARVRIGSGRCEVIGCRSPYSLREAASATYGEGTRDWTGADAAGFAKLLGLSSKIARKALHKNESEKETR